MLDLGKNDDWATKTVEFINELWDLTKKEQIGYSRTKIQVLARKIGDWTNTWG